MAVLKAPLTPRDHRQGDPDAPVVLVEYGDYQCPYCALAEPIAASLVQNFAADLQRVFRHFPLSQAHPLAEAAAQSAEFAGAHGAFWAMHGALFANQKRLSVPAILALAGALNLRPDELQQALLTGVYAAKVREDFVGGVRSGVNGTPCFFVNGVRHDGDYSFEALSAAILAARATAVEARPVETRRNW